MVNPVIMNMVSAFQRAGQKLTRVALDANPDTATQNLDQSIIDAKLAMHAAEASAAVFLREEEMHETLLSIFA